MIGDILHYTHKIHGQLRVVKQCEISDMLNSMHADPLAGHLGVNKTQKKISTRYYWPGMNKDIIEFIGKVNFRPTVKY